VRVTAKHEAEAGVGCVPIGFRRVGQQDGACLVRDLVGSPVEIVGAVIVGVVDAGEVQRIVRALDAHRLVHQHPDIERLHAGHHPDRVVIAQYRISRSVQMRTQLREGFERGRVRAEGAEPKVPGEHAQVVVEALHAFDQARKVRLAHVQVQVAQVQQRVAVEGLGKVRDRNVLSLQLDAQRVAPPPAVQTCQREDEAQERMHRVPVFEMEEVRSPPKNMDLVVALEPEALTQMNVPDARLQGGKLASFRLRAIQESHRTCTPEFGWDSDRYIVSPRGRLRTLAVRYIPNALTLLRFLLIPVLVVLLAQRDYRVALAFFFVSVLTDIADGVIARRWDARSRLGAIADPLADKATMLTVAITLAVQGLLPRWLVAAIVVRDLVIVSGALAFHFTVGRYDMAPTLLSKLNTGIEFLVLALVLASAAHVVDAGAAKPVLYALLAATLVASGVQYVWVWGRRAISHRAGKNASTGR
jgi:cardiolipin synthase